MNLKLQADDEVWFDNAGGGDDDDDDGVDGDDLAKLPRMREEKEAANDPSHFLKVKHETNS